MKKQLRSIMSAFIILIGVIVLQSFAHATESDSPKIVESGKCGKNITWTLDSNNVLELSGTGDTYGYDVYSPPFKKTYSKIIINEGINKIGDYIFWRTDVTSISFPKSLTSISWGNFCYTSLKELKFPPNLQSILGSFDSCNNLTRIDLPSSLIEMEGCFKHCTSLKTVVTKSVFKGYSLSFSGCKDVNIYYLHKDATAWAPTMTEYDNRHHGVLNWKEYCCLEGDEIIVEHTKKEMPRVEATCTKNGRTAGTKCLKCNEIFSGMKTIKKLGHNWKETKRIDATYTQMGEVTYECERCHEKKIEKLNYLKLAQTSITKMTDRPDGVYLKWRAVDHAEGYRVWWGANNQYSFKESKEPSYLLKLEPGYEGQVYVTAFAGDNESARSGRKNFSHRYLTGAYEKDSEVYYYKNNQIAKYTGYFKCDGKWYNFNNTSKGKLCNGWDKANGAWYLYRDGKCLTGWQKDGQSWYYFRGDGSMVTGWQQIKDTWYYLMSSGAMATGWRQIGKSWYYFQSSGAMMTDLQQIGKNWYYFKNSGAMFTGWQKLWGSWYYFKTDGSRAIGWEKIGNDWYFFQSAGEMATDWRYIENGWYCFKSSGALATGWQKLADSWWFYFKSDGSRVTGWKKIGNDWYYFDTEGRMTTGWEEIGNGWYFFKSNGALIKGWLKYMNYWYYFQSDGVMVTDWQYINDRLYIFSSFGKWQK